MKKIARQSYRGIDKGLMVSTQTYIETWREWKRLDVWKKYTLTCEIGRLDTLPHSAKNMLFVSYWQVSWLQVAVILVYF